MTLGDFKRQNRGLIKFLFGFNRAATHISTANWAEITKDGPGQPATHKNFQH